MIELSRQVLGMPADWRLGIVPASDTGAVEIALWSLLGPRPVDVLAFDSFSGDWARDVVGELKLDARVHKAPYGELPDRAEVDWSRDVVLAWNGTTSGVKWNVEDVPASHEGLVICDGTSAAFAMDMPWDRLDVVTWSWQKALGGEAGHGMLALGPRAVDRLLAQRPRWPMPKIFRLADEGRLNEGVFRGETINTPSMLAVEDQLQSLEWAIGIGGLQALIRRTEDNSRIVSEWVQHSDWADFLARDDARRSTTSVCLRLNEAALAAQLAPVSARIATAIALVLERESVAYDIGAYRDAPPGLRIWCGPTVEATDVADLMPWLDWAFAMTIADIERAA